MSSPAIFPFNFRPTSTTSRTGAYTVPSNRYAFVTAFCPPGQTFFINGQLALQGNSSSASSGSGGNTVGVVGNQTTSNFSAGSSASVSYTVPSDRFFDGKAILRASVTGISNPTPNGSVSITLSSVTVSKPATISGGSASLDFDFKAGPGTTITVSASTGGTGTSNFPSSSSTASLVGASIRPNFINSGQAGAPVTASFWCPPDTVFASSGSTRYTVCEFATA
jgi:hypothetical protein